MKQTTIYKLSQWDPEDRIRREDFNADNLKIETALAKLDTSLLSDLISSLNTPILAESVVESNSF